jgi:hypothetical protein
MGLQTKGKNLLWLNVSSGVLKWKDGTANGYLGRLVKIQIKDELDFNKKPIKKVKVNMVDGDQVAIIAFPLRGFFAVGFLNQIGRIDVGRTFEVGVYGSTVNERSSNCALRQDGEKPKADDSTVHPEKVKVGDDEIWDYSKFVPAFMTMVDEVNAKLDGLPDIAELRKGTIFASDATDHKPAKDTQLMDEDQIPF